MKKQKPEQLQPKSAPTTFTEIGGSPVPGLTLRHVLRGHKKWISRIVWSPDGSYLASPSDDMTIRIWDARSGVCVSTLEGHTAGIMSVAWSPDGSKLASGARDGTIKLWDMQSYTVSSSLETPGDSISLAWTLSGEALISSLRKLVKRSSSAGEDISEARTLWIWDVRGSVAKEFSLRATLQNFSLSPDSKIIAGAGYYFDPRISSKPDVLDLFDPIAGTPISNTRKNPNWKNSYDVTWEPQGKFIATGSQDGVVYIWDPYTGQLTAFFAWVFRREITDD